MAIGKKLMELREKKGLSQYEVAELLGIQRARYNSWEQDIANPRTEMLNKLADFFEVDPNELLGHSSSIPNWAKSKDIRDFRKMLEEDGELMFDGMPLDKEDREKILRVAEAVFWDAKKKNKRKPIDD
ncbi:helix-turn-helix domain-containing protein [Paenibacillus sp. NFR01]|uniref:helix-turn-helix domain-containing protein n=1 Tax=Paenibacillus sp. NFR01 TaxID=1566279 RepID=UPI0008D57FA5|nr:helix-turn-helix transcriptional regulator [Paenibacillus sp. NFR01]SEU32569.1 DNA-binding transcriptional regulator, XRE-family HTH domain [Paenibacillus sp. NFR01]